MRRDHELTGEDDLVAAPDAQTGPGGEGTDQDGENPNESIAEAAAESVDQVAEAIEAPDAVSELGFSESPEDTLLRGGAERERERFEGAVFERERRLAGERRSGDERRAPSTSQNPQERRSGAERRQVDRRQNAVDAVRNG